MPFDLRRLLFRVALKAIKDLILKYSSISQGAIFEFIKGGHNFEANYPLVRVPPQVLSDRNVPPSGNELCVLKPYAHKCIKLPYDRNTSHNNNKDGANLSNTKNSDNLMKSKDCICLQGKCRHQAS